MRLRASQQPDVARSLEGARTQSQRPIIPSASCPPQRRERPNHFNPIQNAEAQRYGGVAPAESSRVVATRTLN
jgi:hypothetical protein